MADSLFAACKNISLIVVLALLWIVRQYWPRRRRVWVLPPGPPAWPVIGHMHLLSRGAPHVSLAKLAQTYGPLLYVRLGSMPTVVVSSCDLAREFLSTHDRVFASRPYFGCAARLKGGQDSGLAMARYGPAWRQVRKISHAQLFRSSRVKAAMPIIMQQVATMMGEVRQYAMAGQAYNITAGMGLLAENVICRLLLGQRLEEECDARLGVTLREKVQEVIALFSGRPMIGDFIPWLGFLDVLHKRRIDAWVASVHALLHNVVHGRRPSPDCPGDFLDSLLLAGKDPEHIQVLLLDFLGAGVDTPSVTLDWAMAELLLNPTVMAKLQAEVKKVAGNSLVLEDHHLPHLVYTKAVVKETLRLHTPAPLLVPHMSMEDCKVAGYTIPQGTMLFVNAWAIGRDPKLWDKPTEFCPDRFLDKCEQVDVRGNHYELLPFGSGRRICPGLPLALPIIELTLANLVHSFHWSLPPPPHHTVDMSSRYGSLLSRVSPLLAIPSVQA